MVPALIASAGLVAVSIITLVGQWLSSRNDRALTHQEVDLLKKLRPDSPAARDLTIVIEARIAGWRSKGVKETTTGSEVFREDIQSVRRTTIWVSLIAAVAAVIVAVIGYYGTVLATRG